jgi:hypothetical protein
VLGLLCDVELGDAREHLLALRSRRMGGLGGFVSA